MVDGAILARKLASARQHLIRARQKRPRQLDLFLADDDARDIVVHHLWLAIQDCLDLAMHLVADQGWGPIQTYGDAFGVLREHRVITAPLAKSLRVTAGLRNLIVHRYADLSFETIYRECPGHARTLEAFLGRVATRYRQSKR